VENSRPPAFTANCARNFKHSEIRAKTKLSSCAAFAKMPNYWLERLD
jgi:hypothetical protein